MNSYSLSAKKEIARPSFSTDCCKRAFLSALVHTGGSIVISRGEMKLVLPALSRELKAKTRELCLELFDGVEVSFHGAETVISGKNLSGALFALGIFVRDESGERAVNRGIPVSIIRSDCCAVNYIRGAFLGAGSVSLTTGYHLEFALSSIEFAESLAALLTRFDIPARITKRKDKFVVYIKESEGVSDCLALMGASEAVLELNSRLVLRQLSRETNRRTNCEIANISKTVNASVRQVEDIKLISKKMGLAALPDKLLLVAKARLDNPDDSFSALAAKTGLNKSTLKNRLNKIEEIAESFSDKEKVNH